MAALRSMAFLFCLRSHFINNGNTLTPSAPGIGQVLLGSGGAVFAVGGRFGLSLVRSALYSSPAKIEHSPTDFQSSKTYLETQP